MIHKESPDDDSFYGPIDQHRNKDNHFDICDPPVCVNKTTINEQVGGTHYKDMVIQPWEYISENGLGYAEGNVIKYVSRWRAKNGIEDLKKARQYLDMLIKFEERNKK